MSKTATPIHSRLQPRELARLASQMRGMDAAAVREHMGRYGFQLGNRELGQMARSLFVGDSAAGVAAYGSAGTITPSPMLGVPVQFLQEWLPGFVHVMIQPRSIDKLAGVAAAGNWHTEEIVQPMLEHVGEAVPYGDHTNIPLASFGTSFNRRTVVRFEKGFQVGRLEEERLAEIRIGVAQEKRAAANLSLELARNDVGFYGYNAADTRTYGLLNDPMLSPYLTLPATGAGGSTLWADKTFLGITGDLRLIAQRLRTQGRGLIDPSKDAIVLGLPVDVMDYLTVTSDFGNSVQEWLEENYKNWRVEQIPEFDGANGGSNVGYLYAESVADSGTDGGSTLEQYVPARTFALGVEQKAKGYVEDYSNAVAGIMVKRPYALVRFTGL